MKQYRFCPVCKGELTKEKEERWFHYTCRRCGWTYYRNPLPSVAAFVTNGAGEILLIKRGIEPSRGAWALPTGFIEQDELPEQAVLRELEEETGLKGRVRELIGIYTEKTGLYGDILLIGYEIEATGGRLRAGSDCTRARFFGAGKLPAIPFSSHRMILHDRLSKPTGYGYSVQLLKSKITEAVVTGTVLFYRGSMGIDRQVLEAANLLPGEKVQVLNYNNGERLETYTIAEKAGSGRIILYGPASKKGSVGDKLCILSYAVVGARAASNFRPRIVVLGGKNRIKNVKAIL